jgi:DNA-binding MarR family transcriptional regulator
MRTKTLTPPRAASTAGSMSTPEAAAPRGCTALKLRQLTRRVSQHYDQYVGAAGLKTTQYSLLSAIDKLGPLRPGELAERMEMDASTLTRNLQPLVAAGWVETGPGDDSRSRRVAITPAGHAKRAEAQREWKRAQLALNERLGVARVAALHALLDDSLERITQTHEAGAGDHDE